ncbi:hypothetical protein PCASD_18890 [Puccinia coronata f. sp. avenae]|uniref:Retrotransposon gag domain-containing protein n=1 Tax=Puccinia coronata f. sp. avenae TaxID=200324 RepID=A0A2N5TWR1_9BASI|nr:hypothetical protein PCASD_18890 [Puccinia coronata f. sp. avenae]
MSKDSSPKIPARMTLLPPSPNPCIQKSPSLPPVTPILGLSPRTIPPLSPSFGVRQPEFTTTNVSKLLAELQINNRPIQETVTFNTQCIAELQTNERHHRKEINELKDLLKLSAKVTKIKSTVYEDIQNMRQDLAQVRGGVEAVNFLTSSRLDNLGDGISSYTWWRGFLGKNANAQGLDAVTGSSMAPFVIDELSSVERFLQEIERTFTNHKELEDARKALKALKQGKETIEQFNIIFNSLLYSVDLSDALKRDQVGSATSYGGGSCE